MIKTEQKQQSLHENKELTSAHTLSGTMMFGRMREGDMSMEVFLCFGLCLSRSLCF